MEKTSRARLPLLFLSAPGGLPSLGSELGPDSTDGLADEGAGVSELSGNASPSLGEEPNILFSRPPWEEKLLRAFAGARLKAEGDLTPRSGQTEGAVDGGLSLGGLDVTCAGDGGRQE